MVKLQRKRPQSWGESLYSARADAGLSARQLAARSGVSHATILRTENGLFAPRLSTQEALAAALGMTLEELFPTSSHPALLARTVA